MSGPLPRTIRPYAAYALTGLAPRQDKLLGLDTVRGYLLEIDVTDDNTRVGNPHHLEQFQGAQGLACWHDQVWFARGREVYWCTWGDFTPEMFISLPYEVDGVGIWHSTIYITSRQGGYVFVYNFTNRQLITRFPLPGVGRENLYLQQEQLWLCDDVEQTVYCLDRGTGELHFKVLTPHEGPRALAFHSHPQTGELLLHVAYSTEEAYIRDTPNTSPGQEIAYRDRTFIHPLHYCHYPEHHYTLSNGYLVEMSYVEELSPLEAIDLPAVEWRIALPASTHRQTVKHVRAVGMSFTEEFQDGQPVAVFRFDRLAPFQGGVFGWKALLEVRGIKYQFTYPEVENCPPIPAPLQERYLIDDDELAMDNPVILGAARSAAGTETNLLRKLLRIRNTVYDRLSYGIKPHIDTPDVVWERGVGSCGEYVGVLLALARLNGIACRTVGRYKCPHHSDYRHVPLAPDYNHVWLEFLLPGFGWLPMESNPDDVVERGPYPTRFFMGLPWYHAEIAKGIPFTRVTSGGVPIGDLGLDLSVGDLALNHVQFQILAELPPPT